MASNRVKARSAFRSEKGVLLEGCQRRAATPVIPEVLMRRVSLGPRALGKTSLLTIYRTAGIVKRVNASCTAGMAWI